MPSYILILYNNKKKDVIVGKLGEINFPPGYYYYVGSANSGIHRVRRHFSGANVKKWHIDYISTIMSVLGAVLIHEKECTVALKLGRELQMIPNFGCSDCKCKSHLFYSPNLTLEFLST